MIRGAEGVVLKLHSVYLCRFGKNPDFSRRELEAIVCQGGENGIPVVDGLVMCVATDLDVVPCDFAYSAGEVVAKDHGKEFIKLAFGVEKPLAKAGEDTEASEGCHDS